MTALFLTLAFSLAAGGAPAAISGNGGLTASVDETGRLVSCRWPSPGYFDQLSGGSGDGAGQLPGGAGWALRFGGKTHWLGDAGWSHEQRYAGERSVVIETVSSFQAAEIIVTQTLFVHPALDLLVARIRAEGLEEPPRLFWFQDITPCTRLIPELPVADWALDALNDFAVFADGKRDVVYHFRPPAPDAAAWKRAEGLAAHGASPAEWDVFSGAGTDHQAVWTGTEGSGVTRSFHCGAADAKNGVWRQMADGTLDGGAGAVGACQSALELAAEPSGGAYAATLFLAFGGNRAEVDGVLETAAKRGYAALRAETEAHWRAWLGEAGLVLENNAEESLRRRALLTLGQSTDRRTGAVVRTAVTQPPYALDFPRHGGWVNLALDMAGRHEDALRHLRFYAEAMRKESGGGAPRGALPALLYSDGRSAAPAFVFDLDATAWFVTSAWRHAQFLEPAQRAQCLASLWESIEMGAELLVTWTDGNRGEPLHSFQYPKLRDGQSVNTLLLVYLGVECGIRIAELLGKPAPAAWRARLEDLEGHVWFRVLNQSEPWVLENGVPYWTRAILADSNALWWNAQVAQGEDVVPLGNGALPVAGLPAGAFPDVLRASLQFIAATARLYGER